MTEKSPSAENPAAKSPAKGDDRNVVAVAPGQAGASLEDRLFLFWKNYRTHVFAVSFAVILAIVGRYAWDAYQAGQEKDIRDEFARAKTSDQKRAFARAHPGHPSAGVGLLQVADEAYSKADYATAQRTYAEATPGLTEPALAARSRLGEAMSALQGGDTAKGEQLLNKIATDPKVSDALHVEAWYTIALLKTEQHDIAGAQEALNKLMESKPTRMWMGRVNQLGVQLSREMQKAETPLTPSAAPTTPSAPAKP